MPDLSLVLVVLAGALLVGVLVGWLAARGRASDTDRLVDALRAELDAARRATRDELSATHREDLRHALDTLQQVAGEQLDARVRAGASDLTHRKELIDAELEQVTRSLTQVTDLVQRLDRERAAQLGRVSEQLHGVARSHGELAFDHATILDDYLRWLTSGDVAPLRD